MLTLTGPFTQVLPMTDLPLKGPIADEQLPIIVDGGILHQNGVIKEVGNYATLLKSHPDAVKDIITKPAVALPGFIDCHTHICFGGTRARDYSLRVAGKPYQEILQQGGGIHDTVRHTRAANLQELVNGVYMRAGRHLAEGVTTIEVKSGYGLSYEQEIKMLRAIKEANGSTKANLIPTCLAAHVTPKEFNSAADWLKEIEDKLLPVLKAENLAERVDIFIENEAFPAALAQPFLEKARALGFIITAHADQFSTQGSKVAVEVGAASADHLENSDSENIGLLANSDTVAVALPGASLGLGMQYTPARKLLDAGACLAIATDWNPGSAPMGDLIMQAAILGAAEKLTLSETLAAITYRAAYALRQHNIGRLYKSHWADFISFSTSDFREILYYQGKLKPEMVWKNGTKVIG